MNETKAIAYWMDHLAGDLDNDHLEELNKYLEDHPELKAELEGQEEIWHKLKDIEQPSPRNEMDQRFKGMIEGYQSSETRDIKVDWSISRQVKSTGWQIAAALVIGIGIGWWLLPSRTQQSELASLQTELQEMKKVMILSMIEEPKAQSRLKAVNMVSELPTVDLKIIEQLSITLNTDQNINVRLAALESLTNYWNYPEARVELVRAIPNQDSPLVQVAITDAMLDLREKDAIPELEKLIRSPGIEETVKEKIVTTVNRLKSI